MPHHFIFNRDWFERHGGKAEFEEFNTQFMRLSLSEKHELLDLLSSVDARYFARLQGSATSQNVADVLQFYIPMEKNKEALIWSSPRSAPEVADDERVEDAGLTDDSEVQNYVEISA